MGVSLAFLDVRGTIAAAMTNANPSPNKISVSDQSRSSSEERIATKRTTTEQVAKRTRDGHRSPSFLIPNSSFLIILTYHSASHAPKSHSGIRARTNPIIAYGPVQEMLIS